MRKTPPPAPPLAQGHTVDLLTPGQAFFDALIESAAQAQRSLWLETYIFEFDDSGVRVAQALVAAARRGLDVRLVVDGYGTAALPGKWAQALDAAGVQTRVFMPRRWYSAVSPTHWRRQHRKLALVDDTLAFCGGVNIIDDLRDGHLGTLSAPRLDYAVRVTGPLVGDIQRTMQGLWTRLALWQELEHSAFERVWHTLSRKSAPPPQAQGHTGVRAALLLRDNLQHRRDIERAYLRAIGNARREVLIANAYFIPGYRMRSALRHAVRRGVRVTLLLQGKYEHFMQFHASRSVYGRLLGSGVQIVEYHASHLHGKVAVIDGHWSTVGSSNLDPLSLLMAREANVVVDDAGFSGQLRTHLLQAMRSGGVVLNAQTFTRRPWHQRLADAVALGLMRLLVALTGQRYR